MWQKHYGPQVLPDRGSDPWHPDYKLYIACPWDTVVLTTQPLNTSKWLLKAGFLWIEFLPVSHLDTVTCWLARLWAGLQWSTVVTTDIWGLCQFVEMFVVFKSSPIHWLYCLIISTEQKGILWNIALVTLKQTIDKALVYIFYALLCFESHSSQFQVERNTAIHAFPCSNFVSLIHNDAWRETKGFSWTVCLMVQFMMHALDYFGTKNSYYNKEDFTTNINQMYWNENNIFT